MAINLDAKSLLQQYGQTKQLEIERLLSQYGTSLKETREMYPQLQTAIEQRRLATTFPTQELFFTSTEAAQMGLSLQEGWMLKMRPEGEGYSISFITPQKWEVTEGGTYVSPEGAEYSQADLEALLSVPIGGLETTLRALAIEDLTEEGKSLYGEYQTGGGELDVAGWLDLRERQQLETEQVFGKVFPEQDVQEVLDYMSADPEGFIADIREIGPTEDMVAFLKSMEFEDKQGNVRYLNDEEIQDLFGAPVPEYVPESWIKDNVLDPFLTIGPHELGYGLKTRFLTTLPSVMESIGGWFKQLGYGILSIPAQVGAFIGLTAEGMPREEAATEALKAGAETLKPITVTTDQLISQVLPSIQKTCEIKFLQLVRENDEWWQERPELTPNPAYSQNPWEHTELFRDPGYLVYTMSSSLAYSLSVMATLVVVSAIASPFAGIPAAMMVAAGPEATSMTEELVRQGVPFEEAAQWGELYGMTAGGVETASDLPFLGLIFKPLQQAIKPMWNTLFKGVASRLARAVITGLVITQVEGLEEIVTQVAHNAILKHYDETVSITEDLSQVYIQGVIASLPFGAIGGGASFTTFRANLSEQTGQRYDDIVTEFQDAGLTKQQAQVQAANELAKTPEGEAELSEAIEAAQKEYWAEHGPAPQPIIPELAEGVLQEIEVTQEITKRVTPVTPEVTYAGLVKEINAPEGWKVSIYGENADGTYNVRVVPKEGESVVINNYDRAKPFIEQYQEALRVQQEIGTKGVEVAKARPQKPFMPEAVTPTVPEAEGRQFVGITRSTDPTQSKSPWRVAYTLKGKEYAGHFSSKVKAIEYAKDKLGLDIDPKTLQPIAVPEAVREEVAAEAPYEVRRRYDLLTHLTRAKQKESTERYLFNEFGEDIVVNAANEGLITSSPKRIYTITIKGRDAITAFEEGIWGREFLVTLAHLDTGKRTTTKVRAADELEAGRKAKAQMQAGPRWVVDKVTIPKAEAVPEVPTIEEPWTMSASAYLSQIGVHEPWIAEISPTQMASMSKRQREQYQKKRSAEWDASARAKRQWRDLILAAYHEGRITLETPGLSQEAKSAITLGLIKEKEVAAEQALNEALERNRIKSVDDVKVGDRVHDIMTRQYGTITKKFKTSVRIKIDDGTEMTVNAGALEWQRYDDVKASVKEAIELAPEPAIPKAEAISPYKKPPLRHEVPTFGEVGAVPEYKPEAEGRKTVIEARLKRGESVPQKYLVEFPDLAEKYGIAIPTAEAVTPEVTKSYWNSIPAYQQAELAKSAGLTPRTGTVYWGELTPSERKALTKQAIPETPPGMPEAGLQPSMLEEVPAKEVRPEARGKLVQSRLEDYLKLREYNAKAATDRIAEIKNILGVKGRTPKGEATKGNLRLELARLEALRELEVVENVEELDRLIREVGEELGLREMPYAGYGGKSHMDLVRHPPQRYFKEYTATQLEEMLKVYEQARQTMSPEVPAVSPIKAQDITTDVPALKATQLTSRQVERTIELFKEAVAAPNIESQRAAALELRKHVFAERAKLASESAEAMIAEGMNPEEAIRTAEQQFMAGKLPDLTTDYFSDLTQEMRNVLFAKVYNYWKGKSWAELMSTFEALTNALAGQSIPRIKGIGTKYFPDGGSAWDRLARVFIADMEVLETLDQGKSLSEIIEGVLLETGRGSVPLNQETVNWLKTLATISDEDRLLLEKPLGELTEAEVRRIAQGWFYERRNELNTLLKDGVISQEEYKLQLAIAKDKAFPHKPIEPGAAYPGQLVGQPRLGEIYTPPERLPEARTPEEIRLATFDLQRKYREATEEGSIVEPPSTWAEYNKAFKEVPLLTFKEKGTIIRTLKSIGMTIIDIGNLVRANKASFDFSFWRQARALAAGHPVAFYRANIEAWKALWSQAHAEANWQWITRDPDYELYEQIRVDTGADPLRIFEAPKGTAQWRAAEEMGYLTGERPIPRFTARIPWIKVSGRSFVVGTNTISWLVWKQCLAATRARAMRIASGDIILPEGEGFSISQEMTDYQKYIADAVQRASLGKAAPLAPALSSMFFAPRSKLARLLYPRHLVSSNPRVRALAWKDFSLFVGTISSLVMLGYWLGLWDVERDPRNAEFMSIRIGNMRIDPWAGHRQFIVLYARLTTGTGLSSVTGQEYEVNPIGALTTFFRTSLSPLASILLDFWTGKNFLGEELDIADPEQWLDRIAPFAIQDVWEAFQDDWQNGLIAILPAIVGEGVQTYTGDWRENWQKLGLPKYPENTGYGIDDPIYDLSDFWADTAARFRGVDPATLTESKGYPEYVRSVATALQVIEQIGLLPNKRLTSINADAEEGATFKDYYQMWQDRQRIVASGDEEALKEFDADERTRNAYLGNMSQAQYALLMEYHSLPESEKAEFLGRHPGLYGNPREDWLRSHPEENALLALWDKAKIYSLEALDKMESLAKSLGIPINAVVFEELGEVTKLRIKHDALFDLLDAYSGLDDEVKDDEGLTARDRAIEDLYTNNPDFRDDMRRIEALNQGTEDEPTPEEIVEGWVNRGIVVDEYGAGSAEAKLWLVDNQETHQWALDNALLSDDGTDWNGPILRLLVQYGDGFDMYGAYGDISSDNYIEDDEQRVEARRRLLFDDQENMTSFGKAYYTREASSQGYSESNWPTFVEYSQLPIWGSWRERFLLDNAGFYNEYIDSEIGNHPLVDATKVKPLARDRIYQQFYDEFQAWDETGGMASKAIENMRAGLDVTERGGLTFKEARYSVQAYDVGFPENLIDAYVDWYSTDRSGYDDDWWLMEHLEFYKKMYDLEIWTEPRDFSKVPSREVYALYQTYQGLPSGTPRLDFRAKHPELDDWLVLKFGYKPVTDRGDSSAPPTPWEEAAAVERFKELF